MKRLILKIAVPVVTFFGRLLFGLVRLFRKPRRPDRLGKVLVIKLWAIGEVVMAAPVLEALKRHDPECAVHMLVGETAAAVVAHNPFCDRILEVDENIFLKPSLSGMFTLAGKLRRERYDTAIVLHHFFIFGLFAWMCGIRVRAGLDRYGEGFALTHRVPRPSAPTHRVMEYLSVPLALGVQPAGPAPRIWVPEDALEAADRKLLALFPGGFDKGLVAVLPTGGANPAASRVASNIVTKRWPVAHYVELVRILAEAGCGIVVVGGPGELGIRDDFARVESSSVKILIGQMDLAATMAVLKRCDVVVTNDSGPMHVADALGARVVAVFGPTDPEIVGPYSSMDNVITSGEDCAPCFDESVFPNVFPDCPTHACMKSVTPETVLERVLKLASDTRSH
ncbi:MAG: glycosyltransferase family 9 protein [Planctomycetes bacterium]|nr:glycosyltransferase family 9 protein [Planctomycetota bacterium]